MEKYEIGQLVVLTSGSMRMAVEAEEEGRVSCVWCHEGRIGRDTFDARLLKRWEFREEDARPQGGARPARGGDRGGDRDGGPRPYRGGGDRDGKPYRAAEGRDDKPRGKPGWDGKPREKKFFRKDD